jgi:hydroxymethylcytosylglucuronate/cytosylglucuronate synthase
MSSDAGPQRVAVSTVDFGWGSAGKISSILRELSVSKPALELVVFASALGRHFLADFPVVARVDQVPERDALADTLRRWQVSAGLVVLDPATAQRFEDAGLATVYVDSLPNLWGAEDPLPDRATVYCAQRCDGMPVAVQSRLSRLPGLRWVEAIVPPPSPTVRRKGTALVNVGGVVSPVHPTGNRRYLLTVLPVALAALRRCGFTDVTVCGNIPADVADRIRADARGMTCRVGALGHGEFHAALAGAELLVTSPGLTTILEASSQNCPTVLMPPQNVSQIVNSDRFVAHAPCPSRVGWPREVLDVAQVHRARRRSEAAALEVMTRAFDALRPEAVAGDLLPSYVAAIRDARREADWATLCAAVGVRGAGQVAGHVAALMDAPPVRPGAHRPAAVAG